MTHQRSWRQGKTTAERGYGSRWQSARIGYLNSHPLCASCAGKDRDTAATLVDHIIPHRGDMRLFWDSANWQPLCEPCHQDKTIAERGRAVRPRIDPATGYPID